MDSEAIEAPLIGSRVQKATLAKVTLAPIVGRIPPKNVFRSYPAVLIWKQGLCRCDQIKMGSHRIRIALVQ